jgi:transcriptional regulator with XRE-family HTH domain
MGNANGHPPPLGPQAQPGDPNAAKPEPAAIDDKNEAFGRALVDLRRSAGTEEVADALSQPAEGPRQEAPVDEELARIAQRVRRWREEGELTLQELARRSGVAASTIQKVETQQMVPTIGVLLKIARGLDRAPNELLLDAADEFQVAYLPPQARYRVGVPEGMMVERMVGDLFEPTLETWRVTHEPGSGSGEGLIHFDGEAIIIGEAGVITVRVGDEEYEVRAGDSLHFKTTLHHGWQNRGTESARFLITATLPRKLRAVIYERMKG